MIINLRLFKFQRFSLFSLPRAPASPDPRGRSIFIPFRRPSDADGANSRKRPVSGPSPYTSRPNPCQIPRLLLSRATTQMSPLTRKLIGRGGRSGPLNRADREKRSESSRVDRLLTFRTWLRMSSIVHRSQQPMKSFQLTLRYIQNPKFGGNSSRTSLASFYGRVIFFFLLNYFLFYNAIRDIIFYPCRGP